MWIENRYLLAVFLAHLIEYRILVIFHRRQMFLPGVDSYNGFETPYENLVLEGCGCEMRYRNRTNN